jgi:predicted RNase H-like HicB family nuclease
MEVQMSFVIGLVHGEGNTFGISFPDFPGCVAGGSTLDETVSRGEDALAVHVESMLEDDESLPLPRSRSAILSDPEFKEDVEDAILVAVPMPSARRTRVHVMIDESLLSAVERAAEAEGYTRSGYFERAIRDRLMRHSDVSGAAERSASASADTACDEHCDAIGALLGHLYHPGSQAEFGINRIFADSGARGYGLTCYDATKSLWKGSTMHTALNKCTWPEASDPAVSDDIFVVRRLKGQTREQFRSRERSSNPVSK